MSPSSPPPTQLLLATRCLYRAQVRAASIAPKAPAWGNEDPLFINSLGASHRWFTDSFDEAMWYFNDCPANTAEIVRLELLASIAEQYRVSNLPLKPGGKNTPDNPVAFSRRPEKEFYLPPQLAALAVPVLDLRHEEVLARLAGLEDMLLSHTRPNRASNCIH